MYDEWIENITWTKVLLLILIHLIFLRIKIPWNQYLKILKKN